jgi:DNA topoisomerase-3
VLWLDCDREGEGIAFEVIEVCQRSNDRLSLKRAKFSATTVRDIQNAMRTLAEPNKLLSDAVQARTELDLRLGAAFTRLQTVALGNQFNDLAGKVISYGPCQFPTLGFVVYRFREIATFVSEPFWEVQMGCAAAGLIAAADEEDEDHPRPGWQSAANLLQFVWDRGRVYDEFAAVILYELALQAGTATVEAIEGRPATKMKPVPMNSVDFAVLASKSLKMNSNTASKVAEELYQRGFISYPRTETRE